jgi:translation initiation factor 3 subunit B
LIKKKEETTVEIFSTKEKNFPISSLPFDEKFIEINWESKGKRLCIIHGDGNRNKISFYEMKKNAPDLISTLNDKSVNKIYWSPNGRFCVLANLKRSVGTLEFWNVDSMDMIGKGEHFMCSDCEWDPTGRFFATSVSQYRYQSENGYIIWNFLGNIHHVYKVEKFFQFCWRPRGDTLLTIKEEDDIRRNLNEKKNDFIKEGKLIDEKIKLANLEKRKKTLDDFLEILNELKNDYENEKKMRNKILKEDSSEYEIITEEFIEVLDVKEEFISFV